MFETARAAIPELPAERAARYERDFGLPEDTARLFAFEPDWGDYFEQAAAGGDPKPIAIWVTELRSRDGASVEPGIAREARASSSPPARSPPPPAARSSTRSSPRAATRPRSPSARA